MSSLSEFSSQISDPHGFATAALAKLLSLGDEMGEEDASQLALFMLALHSSKTPLEAENEVADMLTNPKEFTAWVYDFLTREKEAFKNNASKKRSAPDHDDQPTTTPSDPTTKKLFKPIVWDLPEPNPTPLVTPPPAKKPTLDTDAQKRLRSERFGVSLSDPEAVEPVVEPKRVVGIVGRGAGIQARLGVRGETSPARPIAARLGVKGGSGEMDMEGVVRNNEGMDRNGGLQHADSARPGDAPVSNQFQGQQQQQGNFNAQQQQSYGQHQGPQQRVQYGGYNRGGGFGNQGMQQQGHFNNNQQYGGPQQQGFNGPPQQQPWNNNFANRQSQYQQRPPNGPAGAPTFFYDSFGNMVPMGMPQQMGGSGGYNQRGGGGMRGGFGYNQGGYGAGGPMYGGAGGMRGGFRGGASQMGVRPAFNGHQQQQQPPFLIGGAKPPADISTSDAVFTSEDGPTSATAPESEDEGGAEIITHVSASTTTPAVPGPTTTAPITATPAPYSAGYQQAYQPAPCRFGGGCTRYGCTFSHPWDAPPAAMATRQCRYWPNCANPACPFVHPSPGAAAPAGVVAKTDISTVPCKYDAYCNKPACPFKHTNARGSAVGVVKPHVSERVFAAAEAEKVLGEGVIENGSAVADVGVDMKEGGDAAVAVSAVVVEERKKEIGEDLDDEELIDEDGLL
ncbi:hypothetical protein HDU98_006053 [Podochytrium sp. JEL0797]|nr:hypothetical protein HDU98_006053 [Podochytrium sp. JEL0797]